MALDRNRKDKEAIQKELREATVACLEAEPKNEKDALSIVQKIRKETLYAPNVAKEGSHI